VVVGQWIGLLAVAMSLYILWQIRALLLLIFTAIVLATVANHLVNRFERFNIQRSIAVMLTLSTIALSGTLFFILVILPFTDQFQQLIQLIPNAINTLWDLAPNWLGSLQQLVPKNLTGLQEALSILQNQIEGSEEWFVDFSGLDYSAISQQASPLVTKFFENFFAFFNNAVTATLQVLLVLILTLMLLVNPGSYRQTCLLLFPSFYRRRADNILTECELALRNWFAGIFFNSLFVGTLSGLGLWLLGIDLALAHALLAGILNFIPNIGPFLSVIFPLSVALQNPSWKIIVVIIWYVLVQQAETYWFSPLVMSRQVNLLPALTLIAQIFFTSIFGLIGLILALPLAVVLKVWIQEVLVRDILDNWQTSEPKADPLAWMITAPAHPGKPVASDPGPPAASMLPERPGAGPISPSFEGPSGLKDQSP
jgi:predicted PurR-regulated permease PerM